MYAPLTFFATLWQADSPSLSRSIGCDYAAIIPKNSPRPKAGGVSFPGEDRRVCLHQRPLRSLVYAYIFPHLLHALYAPMESVSLVSMPDSVNLKS